MNLSGAMPNGISLFNSQMLAFFRSDWLMGLAALLLAGLLIANVLPSIRDGILVLIHGDERGRAGGYTHRFTINGQRVLMTDEQASEFKEWGGLHLVGDKVAERDYVVADDDGAQVMSIHEEEFADKVKSARKRESKA